jgi:hypothetical protein
VAGTMSVLVVDMQYKILNKIDIFIAFIFMYKLLGIIEQWIFLIPSFETSGIAKFEVSANL